MATLDVNELMNASLGKKLTQAREALGLSIDQVSKTTRIRADKLRYLEADEFTHFSHPSYLRLYLIDYARFLGVPLQEVRDWLPDAGRPGSENYDYIVGLASEEAGQVRKEYFYPRGAQASTWGRWLRIGLALAVIGLLVSVYSLVRDLGRIGGGTGPVETQSVLVDPALSPIAEPVPKVPPAVEVPTESPAVKLPDLLLNFQAPVPEEERAQAPVKSPTSVSSPTEIPANVSLSGPAGPLVQ